MNASSGSGECPSVKTFRSGDMAARYLRGETDATTGDVPIGICVIGALPIALSRMAKSGLGKGLDALIGARPAAERLDVDPREKIYQISLASIVPSALQPRKDFAREALQELIDSIRQHGIIQPLIVRLAAASVAAATGQAGNRYELIAGERRWRAAQEVGLTQVPVIIRSASDLEVLELSLIEN